MVGLHDIWSILQAIAPYAAAILTVFLSYKRGSKEDENDRLSKRNDKLTKRVDYLTRENDRLRKELYDKNDN